MKLTQQQIDDFNREGWLFLPELFSPEEVDYLAREAVTICLTPTGPEVWREKSGAPRTAFAAHLYNEAFRTLGAPPHMIAPIEQLSAKSSTCISSRSTRNRLLRRSLAMTPGLRHLEARRRHAASRAR